jgi:hypothetical protein
MQPEPSPAAAPEPFHAPGLRPRPVGDVRLVAGFLLAHGLVTLLAAACDWARGLPPTVGAAPVDLLLALGLAAGIPGAVAFTRLRLVAMLAMATWGAVEYGDVAGGFRAALLVVPGFVLLSRPAWPLLRLALRGALIPVALLLATDALVAAGDLWFPVGPIEYGNRFSGPPVEALEAGGGMYRIPLRPGRWRKYRPEYLSRFVPAAESGVVEPYTGVDLLVFREEGAVVDGDPTVLQRLVEESLDSPPVELEVDHLEAIRPGDFDLAAVASVHGAIGGAEVRGYVAFYVRDDVTYEVWAVGHPEDTARLDLELREAVGRLGSE